MSTLNDVVKQLEAFKGGSGSGNFGHLGRPGKRGGSVGSGVNARGYGPGGKKPKPAQIQTGPSPDSEEITNAEDAIYKKFPNVDPNEVEDFLGNADYADPKDAVRQFTEYMEWLSNT